MSSSLIAVAEVPPEGEPSPPQEGPSPPIVKGEKCVCVCSILTNPILSWAVQLRLLVTLPHALTLFSAVYSPVLSLSLGVCLLCLLEE